MKKILCLASFAASVLCCFCQTVSISYDKTSPQQMYAGQSLEKALVRRGYAVKTTDTDYLIKFLIDKKLGKEAFTIKVAPRYITVTGGNETGIIYGSLSIVENLRNGMTIQNIKAREESPGLAFRAIKFDLPWDTYRHSYALDLHSETCKDVNYWKAFLDMMAENRLNVLSLWNLHPYVYMIKPKNFPEASPWTDKEMKQWQTLFRSIFQMAKERGIDTYVIPFNIFVSPEFAKAHNVAMDNLDHHFFCKWRYFRNCKTLYERVCYSIVAGVPRSFRHGTYAWRGHGRNDATATGRLDERNHHCWNAVGRPQIKTCSSYTIFQHHWFFRSYQY